MGRAGEGRGGVVDWLRFSSPVGLAAKQNLLRNREKCVEMLAI